MIRMFDSMVFEDEVTDEMALGVVARGELSSSQTRDVLFLGSTVVLISN